MTLDELESISEDPMHGAGGTEQREEGNSGGAAPGRMGASSTWNREFSQVPGANAQQRPERL